MSFPLDRTSPDVARRVIEALLPDADVRRRCLAIFADAVEEAHACSPDVWGVTMYQDRVRLVVGELVLCTLHAGRIWLVLDPAASDTVEQIDAWETGGHEYLSLDSVNGYYLPRPGEHERAWPKLEPFFLGLIPDVARRHTRLHPRSQGSHSPGVLLYLEAELGRLLPRPVYWKEGELEAMVEEDLTGYALEEERFEGKTVQRLSNVYERDATLRALAVRIHGTVCKACGFDFAKAYGERGRGFIEVHHIRPVSTLGGTTSTDPHTDLTVVCANCHRMIHRRADHVLTIDELKALLAENRNPTP